MSFLSTEITQVNRILHYGRQEPTYRTLSLNIMASEVPSIQKLTQQQQGMVTKSDTPAVMYSFEILLSNDFQLIAALNMWYIDRDLSH